MVDPAPRPMRLPPPVKIRRERSATINGRSGFKIIDEYADLVRYSDDDEAVDEFSAALAKVQARRSTAAPASKRIDYARVAANMLARASAPKPAKPAPTMPAPSRESCAHCGVPGSKGCDHWLPCDVAPVAPKPARAEAGEIPCHSGKSAKRLTADEMAFVEARRAMPRKELHAEFVAAFPDRQITVTSINYILARAGGSK